MSFTRISVRPKLRAKRRPNLERDSILFTVGLYLFIACSMLAVHLAARGGF